MLHPYALQIMPHISSVERDHHTPQIQECSVIFNTQTVLKEPPRESEQCWEYLQSLGGLGQAFIRMGLSFILQE